MLANLATSVLDKERVTTTLAKAKEVRGVVERLITYGKKGSLHGIRLAARSVKDKDVLKKLFDDIAPMYKEREGGYTRIVKLGERRGDNAELSIIELVGREGDEPRRRKKKKAAPKASAEKRKTQSEKKDSQVKAPSTEGGEEVKPTATSEESVSESPESTSAQATVSSEEKEGNENSGSGEEESKKE
jgi:large subunit ribosomal protein L17